MSKLRPIFAIVGPSGCGKTTLIERMIERYPDNLGVVRTVTTRNRREGEDDTHYQFVSDEEFTSLVLHGRLIQNGKTSYAGHYYDNDRLEIEELLALQFGICAWIESTVTLFRELGYSVFMVRVTPSGANYMNRSSTRKVEDNARENIGPVPDKVIVNSFDEKDGLDVASDILASYISSCMC